MYRGDYLISFIVFRIFFQLDSNLTTFSFIHSVACSFICFCHNTFCDEKYGNEGETLLIRYKYLSSRVDTYVGRDNSGLY